MEIPGNSHLPVIRTGPAIRSILEKIAISPDFAIAAFSCASESLKRNYDEPDYFCAATE